MVDDPERELDRGSPTGGYYRTRADHLWRALGVLLAVMLGYLQLVEERQAVRWGHYLGCVLVAEPRAIADLVRLYGGDLVSWLKAWGPRK